MFGLYLCCGYDRYYNYPNLKYLDIDNNISDLDYCLSCFDLSFEFLNKFDYFIVSPPCNFYSRGNYRRYSSEYSLRTKYLLPYMLDILICLKKPFIVENVRNSSLLPDYSDKLIQFVYGRHTYYTNVNFSFDFPIRKNCNIQFISRKLRQGDDQVHSMFENFLSYIHCCNN